MFGKPDSIVLQYLRAIDTNVDALGVEVAEVKQRLTTLAIQVTNLSVAESSHHAQIMQRLDRHETRLYQIGRRLDLIDVPAL